MTAAEFRAVEAREAPPEVIAERAVLGRAIMSARGAAEMVAVLRSGHFSLNARKLVFEAIERLVDAGTGIGDGQEWHTAVLLELARTGHLAAASEPGLGSQGPYLHSLTLYPGEIGYYAPVIIAAARRRGMTAALESALHLNRTVADYDPDVHLERIRKMVEDAAGWSQPAALRPNSEAVNEVLAAIEAGTEPGLTTGYLDLDDVTGGLRPGELIVIGARPGVGKTALGLCIADHVGTRLGLPTLFFSLEMTEAELTLRRISAASRVPLYRLVRGQVSDAEWDLIARAHAKLTETRLHIDDTPGASLGHIRGQVRAMERTGDRPRLVVIDYLGFMAAPKADSRQQAVSELARGVKMLAREFAIPVILLAQLNRGPEHRSDKLPTMADLRETGETEQSADIVILLHREDAYASESPRAGEIDLIIDKNRQGPRATVTLGFQGHYGRVVSLAADWSPSSAALREAS